MATAVISLNTWSVEYYETMAAAERTRLKIVESQRVHAGVRLFAGIVLWRPFRTVVHETEKLVACLERLEALPSSVLVEGNVKKIPASLRDLFKTMCEVIQMSEEIGLHKTRIPGASISRLAELSQQISGFADRYEDSQRKVLSRISNEDAVHYKDSFEAYGHCNPITEEATEEDVKRELLHF